MFGMSAVDEYASEVTEVTAEARAAQVEDLKEKVAELRLDFSKQISELRGAVSAMESLKSEQIAQKVSDAIRQTQIVEPVDPDKRGLCLARSGEEVSSPVWPRALHSP